MRESEVMSDQGVGAAQVLRAILPGRAQHEDRVAPIPGSPRTWDRAVGLAARGERTKFPAVLVELAQNERC